ncbi:MAG: LD-carboxypeptidase [Clostridiales bacterium]|nr:LD-carboxypeptidase [Clostridiales bacterium]
MRYPEFLKPGGTIGFIAPSFGCNIEPYYSAFEYARIQWKQDGYRLDPGPNCFEGSGIGISSTPQRCGQEIMDYYTSDKNDILISCGGGELMCEDLDFVDFSRLAEAKPKWFMGYSDNTNLTFLLTTLCDVASVYGPCAAAFGMAPRHPALYDAMDILTGKKWSIHGYDRYEKESKKDALHPRAPYFVTEPCERKSFPAGDVVMEGRLLGGCLDVLVNILGTRFDHVPEFTEKYSRDGIIWFLESCDLNVMGIRRAIWQMKNAGWFRHVKGFLVGRPLCHGQNLMGLDQYHAVIDLLEEYQVPIVMDLDLGHIPPMMPLVTGSMARAALKGNEFTIEMRPE